MPAHGQLVNDVLQKLKKFDPKMVPNLQVSWYEKGKRKKKVEKKREKKKAGRHQWKGFPRVEPEVTAFRIMNLKYPLDLASQLKCDFL